MCMYHLNHNKLLSAAQINYLYFTYFLSCKVYLYVIEKLCFARPQGLLLRGNS